MIHKFSVNKPGWGIRRLTWNFGGGGNTVFFVFEVPKKHFNY